MRVWRFQLSEAYVYHHPLLMGITFANDWMTIVDGSMTINLGYAWDGCSPKRYCLGLLTVGTPDGALRLGKPWTWEASLVHDALCQYRQQIPLTKQQVTQIFNDQLAQLQWPLRRLYVWAVTVFGPQDFGVQQASS